MEMEKVMEGISKASERCQDYYAKVGDIAYSAPATIGFSSQDKRIIGILNDWSFQQLCGKLQIPYTYIRRCPGGLRETNINHWLHGDSREWLIRMREGIPGQTENTVRAVLSSRYDVINNLEVANVMKEVTAGTDFEIVSWNIEDEILWIRYKTGEVEGCRFGFVVENSEVGKNALVLQTSIKCNGMSVILPTGYGSYYHRHLGVKMEEVKDAVEYMHSVAHVEQVGNLVRRSKTAILSDSDISLIVSRLEKVIGKDRAENFRVYASAITPGEKTAMKIALEVSALGMGMEAGYELQASLERLAGRVLLGA